MKADDIRGVLPINAMGMRQMLLLSSLLGTMIVLLGGCGTILCKAADCPDYHVAGAPTIAPPSPTPSPLPSPTPTSIPTPTVPITETETITESVSITETVTMTETIPITGTDLVTPTATPDDDQEPSFPLGLMTTTSNLRSEPIVEPRTIVGQVCVNDEVAFLEERPVEGQIWRRVRVTRRAPTCSPMPDAWVNVGAEGWINGRLATPPTPVP